MALLGPSICGRTPPYRDLMAQRSCAITGSTIGIYSRNWQVIWRLVSDCTRKHQNNRQRRNTRQQNDNLDTFARIFVVANQQYSVYYGSLTDGSFYVNRAVLYLCGLSDSLPCCRRVLNRGILWKNIYPVAKMQRTSQPGGTN